MFMAITANYSIFLLTITWQITGTWRSAVNHKEKTGRKVWATIAQVMLLVSLFNVAKTITTGTKQIIEVGKVALGVDELSKYQVKLIGSSDLQINGHITFQMIDEINNYLRYNPNIVVIRLNSIGGRIAPAMHLANKILEKNLTTFTDLGCLSACTVIFSAGKKRVAEVGAKFGFHQSSFVGASRSEMRTEEQKQIDFLFSRGISRAFLNKAYSTSSKKMWFPNFRELMNAKFLTHVRVGEKFIRIKKYCRNEDCNKISSAPQWLQKTAAEANLSLPKKLDRITRLDRVTAGPGKQLTYNYTITRDVIIKFDIAKRKKVKLVCKSNKLDIFVKNNITLRWKYLNRARKKLNEIVIVPSKCNKLMPSPK